MTFFLKRAFLMAILLSGVFTTTCRGQALPSIPQNQLELPLKKYQLAFQWLGDSTFAVWEPHAALLLPVKLPSCSQQLYMQLDLGSPYSLFYRPKLEEIALKYPLAIQLADTAFSLKNFTFTVGKIPVHAKEIQVKPFGSGKTQASAAEELTIIGTIGADFIDGRVVLIDYPKQEIILSVELPSNIQKHQLSDFVYLNRSVLLPAVIKGKRTMLFFDTGASAFELLTDKETYDLIASPKAVPVHYKVKSWNRILTAHTTATSDSLEMALQKIAINRVTYIEGASAIQVEQMMKMGIGGMTGNKLFLNHRLLLDTKNKKFIILEASQKTGKIKSKASHKRRLINRRGRR